MKPRITLELLTRLKSKRGGYTRAALQQVGVPWPPPRGWHKQLVREAKENAAKEAMAGTTAPSFNHVEVLSLRFGLITPAERVKWLESKRQDFCFICGQTRQQCGC